MAKDLETDRLDTLGEYYDICAGLFGKDSRSAAYFRKKIDEAKEGRKELVLQDQGQMMILIAHLEATK